MFRIGEFATLTSISIHMLRNYDKIGLLCPESTDEWTGYRFYSEQQIIKANRIQALKAMGLGLKEIKEMLDEESFGEAYEAMIRGKIKEKQEELEVVKDELRQLEMSLNKALHKENYICDITVKNLPAHNVIAYRKRIHQFHEEGRLWEHLMTYCSRNAIKLVPHGFSAAIQHEVNHEKHYSDIEVVTEVEQLKKDVDGMTYYQLPECMVAAIAFQGMYQEIGNINYHLGKWITSNDYELCQSPICVYYRSPGNETDEDKFLTEMCFPIKKKLKKAY